MKFNTIIFDLDGTLLNTIDDLVENVNLVLKQQGYPVRTFTEIKSFIGDGIFMLITRALPKDSTRQEILRCFDIFTNYYLTNMYNHSKPYDGIIELLKELKLRNIKTAVVSNKLDQATQKMCQHYFGDLISVAIGDNKERKRKPEPDNVLEALKQIGSTQEESVYVGDTKIDVETARNSKLPVVGVSWGYRGRDELSEAKADYIIDEPWQLLEYMIN